MVFIQFTKICLYVTILYNMKKHEYNNLFHRIPDTISRIKNIKNKCEHTNWKLLIDSPLSETGW
jgi:hypothetical protein